MRLILFGPQGSGKGTQAQLLQQELGLTHINTGDLLRRETTLGTRIGQRIKPIMDRGEIVPQEITDRLIAQALRGVERGFVIEGYPRTVAQAAALDAITSVDAAFLLDIPDAVALERIRGRLMCSNGHGFHRTLHPPRKEGICDHCGLPLSQRSDDTAAAVLRRLETYHRETEPAMQRYRDRLVRIDATAGILDVHRAVLRELRRLRTKGA